MDPSAERTKVVWREWDPTAFAAARERGCPVLLSLSARWCGWCHAMDRATYDEPRVAANVNDDFVPVRVDVDRRPRVRERYNVGGFPSTVFLTPDGEVLTGATYLDADGMRQVLDRVRERWDESGTDAGRVPRALRETDAPRAAVTVDVERLVAGQLTEQYDDAHAGWGTDVKFPLPDAIEFALKRERAQALATLDAITAHLYDDAAGGFFRYAGRRDWSSPQREKLLGLNARLVGAYASAYLSTGDDAYLDPARGTVEYLTSTLWTGDAFGGSQEPVPADHRPDAARATGADPPIGGTAFADANANAATALLALCAYTDDEHARRYAARTLAFIDSRLVADGVVTHFEGSDSTCLLADQAAVCRAFTTAAQVLDPAYVGAARTVADATVERLATDGVFVDGPADGPGLLDRPLRPIDENAAMANALVDLHALTGVGEYRNRALDAVGAFAGAADRMGVQLAGYATAAARAVRPPLRIAVADEPGSDLNRAALRMADHEKVVVPRAAEHFPDEDYEPGRAYVLSGDDVSAPAATPTELADRVSASAG